MDDDMWAVSSSGSSRSHRSAATTAKYQSGSYLDSGDFEEDEDDVEVDYPCPFCSDDYDLVELCHHIDEEHNLEATHGVCPVCSKRVKMHMVDHITTHHRDVLKSGQKETYEEDPYSSSDNYLQDDLSPSMNHHHTSKTDEFLSFLNNSPLPNQTKPAQEVESSVEDKALVEDSGKDRKLSTPLSDSEQLEKANKCEFVQGLLSSAMFDDGCDFF
ncbi:PREDICTED: protein DEHYDRATION-INDUCED 19 homolog 2 [Brassica oleracea var. oleracea]|uniref:Drought induced 19 protein type zinc-binding domain-containing protein n=1 Tax=Brassica oleracea var. oleracea TaxID=109376 RepID=A0A0D3C767_BRAOL|nr:PREDICTED: protein DEHYDRATION-INDUCED 19 homolog 2 [Brassica oleracea var. oleracea]